MHSLVMKKTDVLEFFPNDWQDPIIHFQYSRVARAKNGCTMIVKAVQFVFMEGKHIHEAAVSDPHDEFCIVV